MPDVIYAAWSDNAVGTSKPWGLWMPIDYYHDNTKYISEAKHKAELSKALAEQRELLKLIHKDLKMRADEDGVINISDFIWKRLSASIEDK